MCRRTRFLRARSTANGLPIAWELQNFGHTGVDPNADPDGDGMSNLQEYLAGTNPNDANDYLRITAIGVSFMDDGNDNDTLVWTSHPTRQYRIQQCTNLASGAWMDAGVVALAGCRHEYHADGSIHRADATALSPHPGGQTARTLK